VADIDAELPSAANSKLAARYDQVPYVSFPHGRSHPARIAMVAQMLGVAATSPDSARVLEIGCASGGHIIPLAVQYPHARFVGLDLSPVQIESGRARIQRLGLANIELVCGDLAEWAPDGAGFDYVLCHGVYSWVPTPVRQVILRQIAKHLSANGIAYVSYNTLPGWRLKQVFRDALISQTRDLPDVNAQIARAKVLIEAWKGWNSSGAPHARLLRFWADKASSMPDDYLAHEFLEEANEPQTFTDFVDDASRASLGYLGDLDLWMSLPENFDAETRRMLELTADNLLVPTEQMIDVLTGREFRRTLLVHEEIASRISRQLDRGRIQGLHFAGDYKMAEPASTPPWTFTAPNGRTLSTNIVSVRAAFEALSAAYPASMSLGELADLTNPETADGSGRAEIVDALFAALAGGLIDARTDPLRAASEVTTLPRAPTHCRIDALGGESVTATLRHEPFLIDVVGRILLPLLDGTRDKQALAQALIDAVKAGELRLDREGVHVTHESDIADSARDNVNRALATLQRAGMLEP
jgi:methyltransferase-like protein/cyclopropane fatty-acyl-phospholipid synthase-like methyltransferase